MAGKKVDKLLLEVLESPIAFHRIYVKITGSVNAGLLLSQLCYWDSKMHKIFYKTNADFADELGMGPGEFKRAKKALVKAGLITVTKRGVPAKSHYKLHRTAVLAQISSWFKTTQLVGSKRPIQLGQNEPTITETSKAKTKDYTETTKAKEKLSDDEMLALDLEIREKSKKFMEEIAKALKPGKASARTFASVTIYLVEECQKRRLEPSVFDKAIGWAKRVAKSRTATNKCGLFMSVVKDKTNFKKQDKILE